MLLDEIKDIKESKKDLKKFGLTVGIALIILAVLLYFLGKKSAVYFGASGLLLIISALIAPGLLKTLNKVWMTFSIILGWIMTRVILIIFFYLVITPTSLLTRLFKKDFLDLKIDKTSKSYWKKRDKRKSDTVDFERQF